MDKRELMIRDDFNITEAVRYYLTIIDKLITDLPELKKGLDDGECLDLFNEFREAYKRLTTSLYENNILKLGIR